MSTRDAPRLRLRLYVAGQTPKSITAITNLKRLCRDHLAGRYSIDIVDLLRRPHLARRDEIIVIPTLVRRLPPPIRRIIGDLSNQERVLVGLDALAQEPPGNGHARPRRAAR